MNENAKTQRMITPSAPLRLCVKSENEISQDMDAIVEEITRKRHG